MKTCMNLLLWMTHVTEETFGLMAALKETGFDPVEIPLGPADPSNYRKIRLELDRLGFDCTSRRSFGKTNPMSPLYASWTSRTMTMPTYYEHHERRPSCTNSSRVASCFVS